MPILLISVLDVYPIIISVTNRFETNEKRKEIRLVKYSRRHKYFFYDFPYLNISCVEYNYKNDATRSTTIEYKMHSIINASELHR